MAVFRGQDHREDRSVRPPVAANRTDRSRALGIASLLLSILLLAACADITEAPLTPQIDRTVPTETFPGTPAASRTTVNTPPSPVKVPNTRRIYFTKGGDLWQLPVDNAAAPVVTGRDILAFAPSPDGERVAVAFQEGGDAPRPRGTQFAIIRADSTTELQLKDPDSGKGSSPAVRSLAWSPQGLAVAVARQDGSITVIDASGKVRQVVPPRPGSSPGGLAWSPDGSMLLYLDPAFPGQPTSLYTVSVNGGSPRRVVAGTSRDHAVIAATWLPGRDLLAYVLSSSTTIDQGGDIFAARPDGSRTALLVSAGQFAPIAGAIDLAASPDGRYLALTVYVPGQPLPLYQSLRLLDLTTHRLTTVSTARGEAVTDLWWAAGQLIFRAIDQSRAVLPGVYTGTEPFALYQVDVASGSVRQRYRP